LHNIVKELTHLVVELVVAGLVWNHYRQKTFPSSARYSTFGPRFWTGSVDSCVLWPLSFITSSLLFFNISRSIGALIVIVESLTWLVYIVVMHARYGQTIGKMVTKVRVVDFKTEGSISWRQAWIREGIPLLLSLGLVVYEVSSILSGDVPLRTSGKGAAFAASRTFWLLAAVPGFWFLAEVLTMLTNKKRRALHDFIAGTVVVRTNID
jgi:uncharacterized RDD family membrane protein YckC